MDTKLEDLAAFDQAVFTYDHYFGVDYGDAPPEIRPEPPEPVVSETG